jgi:ribulose-phosphate 3-epimerase
MSDLNPKVGFSILGADYLHLGDEIKKAEDGGIDYFHMDVMDGNFVPPITFGADIIASIRKVTALPVEVHLMIDQPEHHIQTFVDAGVNGIIVHAEATKHLNRVLGMIHNAGCRAGVALNPATPVSFIKDIAAEIDLILVMTINPGWAKQKFISDMIPKMREARALLSSLSGQRDVEVDGGINPITARLCVEAGVNMLASASAITSRSDYGKAIREIRG